LWWIRWGTRFISGGTETIDVDADGNTIKAYTDLLRNRINFGFQPSGQPHKDYKETGIKEGVDQAYDKSIK